MTRSGQTGQGYAGSQRSSSSGCCRWPSSSSSRVGFCTLSAYIFSESFALSAWIREPGAGTPLPSTRGGCGKDLVAVAGGEGVGAVLADRQVPLAVAALGRAHDDAGLVAVEQLLVVVPLQRDAPALGDHERDHGSQEHRDPHEPGDLVDAEGEGGRDDVVAAGHPEEPVEGHQRRHGRRARGGVAGPLEQVVLPLVAGDPGFDEGQDQDHGEHQPRQHDDRQEDVPAQGVTPEGGLPAREDPQGSVGPSHVPVGLGAGGDLGGVVGAVPPHRVDRQQPTHQGQDPEDHEEEPAGLGHVDRQHREAHDVLLGPAGTGPLGVLVEDEQQHVGGDQGQDQPRDQQHVGDVEPRDDHLARELAAEEEERHVAADDRRGLHEAVRRAEAGAGEQVVGQRVAGESLQRPEEEQEASDHPVELARLAERPGHEDPDQVHEHAGDEDHRRPVVDLAHQQAAADLEGDVQGGGVGLRHLDAAELVVGPFVGHLGHARLEPQGQEHPGEQEYDEAPQRDLAEHERPVVGEDLAQVLLHRGPEAEPLVGPVGDPADPRRLARGGGLGAVAPHETAGVDAHGPALFPGRVALRWCGATGRLSSEYGVLGQKSMHNE